MQVRLNKYLSQAGVASRREADSRIAESRVKVNGLVVQELGFKIDPARDRVEVDGKKITVASNRIYIMLNKPPGFLVTARDPFNRQTVMQLLPAWKGKIFPVGRLDYESEGLLLLTDDGELAHRLMHPRYEVPKTYLVQVEGEVQKSSVSRLEKGIVLDGRKTSPARIFLLRSSRKESAVRMVIHEGRKREVRRMWAALGHHVLRLKRVSYGELKLGRLPSGQWRRLTLNEARSLRSLAGLS
jgi:pseudouridine synthase